MRKNIFGRQFKRDRNERKALFKTLLSSLVMHERIITSEAKAKAIKSDADKLITKAKKGGLHGYKLVEPELSTEAVKKLIQSIAPRFDKRAGGYTRIIRVGRRVKDNSQQVMIEWTEKEAAQAVKTPEKDVKNKSEAVEKERAAKTETKKADLKKPAKERVKKESTVKKKAKGAVK